MYINRRIGIELSIQRLERYIRYKRKLNKSYIQYKSRQGHEAVYTTSLDKDIIKLQELYTKLEQLGR